MRDKKLWSSKLVHKEGKNFFIRSFKLNPFPSYLNVIVVKSTMERWYDYLKEKNIDIWEKISDTHPDFDCVFDNDDQKLVEDFLNNEHNPAMQVSSNDGGVCIFSKEGNQWFMLIKYHGEVKPCLTILAHETQHVIQKLGIEYNLDMNNWSTAEIFAYTADTIFRELFDDIAKQYSLF